MSPPNHPAQDPDTLAALIDDVTKAIKRAYAEGYRRGCHETTDRMVRAATLGLEQRIPSVGPVRTVPATTMMPPPPRTSREYGNIINTFRRAILASPETGITR